MLRVISRRYLKVVISTQLRSRRRTKYKTRIFVQTVVCQCFDCTVSLSKTDSFWSKVVTDQNFVPKVFHLKLLDNDSKPWCTRDFIYNLGFSNDKRIAPFFPRKHHRARIFLSRYNFPARAQTTLPRYFLSKLINFNKKKGRTSGRNVKIFLWKFREKVGTQQSSGSPFNFRFDRENTRYIALYKIGGDWGKQRSDQRVD